MLIPTLIAGLFGANVDYPGEDTIWGLFAMLALIAASLVVVRRWVKREEARQAAREEQRRKTRGERHRARAERRQAATPP